MNRKRLKVAALQLPSQAIYADNLDRLLSLVRQHQDKAVIVAPEVYLTAYDYAHLESAAAFSRKALDLLQREVGDQIVVLTLILKEDDGFINRAVVIHKHTIVYQQEKAMLFKLGEEDRYLRAGDTQQIMPFEIDGVKYALLICFELRFKELWKQIEDVDIVLVPARWGLPRKVHLEILSRALAVMNQCYVIVANSSDADMASASAIISPDGKVIQEDEQTVVKGTVDFHTIKKIRRYIVMK
ncbi:MAG TPA: carbon-nitrogen hydrolase family protein [Epsilonproteobacteria bacterium]|nr:carbon-nitrogen hydrolase family protein [Campylobacterota bacterium]HHH37919.1 carbon-nitrogen hydrolase family protein [Campylobacterota bacterium]